MRIIENWMGTCALATLVVSATALADEVTIEPSADSSIFELFTENSSGIGDLFAGRTGNFGGGAIDRALIRFDVAGALPAGATVTEVELSMFVLQVSTMNAQDQVMTLHRLLANWGEGESDANGGTGAGATEDDATWLHRFYDDVLWTNEGGDFDPVISGQTVSSVAAVPGPLTWPTSPGLVADVQSWLDAPASNFGWMVRGNEKDLNTARRFDKRESAKPVQRPTLRIVFETGSECAGDLDGDEEIGFGDLVRLLANWGPCGTTCDADFDESGDVGFDDLVQLLAWWGPCP